MLVTVVTMSSSAPGTPESERENVWTGRTARTAHWSSEAVTTRFTTYGVDLDEPSRRYVEAVAQLPAFKAWYADAQREPQSRD